MADSIFCPKCSAPNPLDTMFCGKCGAKVEDKSTQGIKIDPLIGSFVGDRFLVHDKLGEGGMGVVYRAEQTAINRRVALKVLHAHLTQDENLHARFHNEAAASSRLTHPNTITVYDFGKTDSGSLYIAMEFIEGKSLDDEIHTHGALDYKRACRIASQMCGSLLDAHRNNIVHRDLKPENVMLCERGGDSDYVKVLDFGIAKILEDDGTDQRQALTKTGMVFGTPQYMSPEQIRGESVDHRTDIYSLGVILYQMLTGSLPFTAEMPMGVLSKHLMDEPPPLKTINAGIAVPSEVEKVVMSTLAKEADMRPSDMKTLADLLEQAVSSSAGVAPLGRDIAKTAPSPEPGKAKKEESAVPPTSVSAGSSKGPGPVAAPRKKRGIGLAIGIVVTLIVLGGGASAWYFLAGPGVKPPPKYRSAQPVVPPSVPTPPVHQVGLQPPQATHTPPQATLPPIAARPDGTGLQPQPTPQKRDKGKKDIPKAPAVTTTPTKVDDKDKKPEPIPPVTPEPTPPPKRKDKACSFLGSKDPVAKAIRKSLKVNESKIRKCLKNSGSSKSTFSFKVPAGKSRLSNIKSRVSSTMDGCLKSLLKDEIETKDKVPRQGTASFKLSKKDDVVEECDVAVNARPGLTPTGSFTKKLLQLGKKTRKPKKPTKKTSTIKIEKR